MAEQRLARVLAKQGLRHREGAVYFDRRALGPRAPVHEGIGDTAFSQRERWAAATVRTQMRIRDRLYLALDEVERTFGKPVRAIYPDAFGVTYRGRLVAYAENERGERFALLDEGREIRPVPTERRDLAVGRPVRARLVSTRDQAEATEQERRRGLLWQLADHELERDGGRGR